MRYIWLLLYYGLAKHLPKSTNPILGKLSKQCRAVLCKKLFAQSGNKLNVEQGAYFGNGKDINVGYEVGLGRNFQCRNVKLSTGDYLMMGEDVLFQGDENEPVAVYNVLGQLVLEKRYTRSNVAEHLKTGLYIIGNRKVFVSK